MPGIFVSYRRADSASDVGRIVERLRFLFGKKQIFNDVFDIQGGEKFRDVIRQQLAKCKVVLVVIGNQWVNIADEAGKKRLLDPSDYVRMEVETALLMDGCIVIPVLVNLQSLPKKDQLPESLSNLLERNAIHVRPDPDFADDLDKLCKQIAKHVPRRQTWPKVVAGLVLTFCSFIGAYLLGPGRKETLTNIQAFDATTGDRLLSPFALTIDNNRYLPPATEHSIATADPNRLVVKKVDVKGFKSKPIKNSIEPAGSGNLLKLTLDRILTPIPPSEISFMDSIQPIDPYIESDWPSDDQIKQELKKQKEKPDSVTLIVENKLEDRHLDLMLYWLPPSDTKALSNP